MDSTKYGVLRCPYEESSMTLSEKLHSEMISMSTCTTSEPESIICTDTDTDDTASHDDNNGPRPVFSLRAFSEMKDTTKSAIVPQDLYKHPPSVVELDNGSQQTSDDSVIKRLTMGKMARTVFDQNQKTTSTTTRR